MTSYKKTKILLAVTVLGIIFGIRAQHNYDNQNILYSNDKKVGIGTENPTEKLQIYDDINGPVFLGIYNNNVSSNSVSGIRLGMGDSYDVGTNLSHKKRDNTFYFENTGAPNSRFVFLTRKSDGTSILSLKINENGNVGIGTSGPQAMLHVNNGDNSYGTILATANNTAFSLYSKTLSTGPPSVESFRIGLKCGSSENNGFISFYRGIDSRHGFLGFSTNGTERIRISSNGNVGIGTATPDEKLTVKGNIHAREVKVTATAGGADFVFKDKYKLPSLAEVEQYINKNKHLSGIPSAEEMKKEGIRLAEMNISLLQKIEELTLYTIRQQKEIERLKNENKAFKSIVGELATIKKELHDLKNAKK